MTSRKKLEFWDCEKMTNKLAVNFVVKQAS